MICILQTVCPTTIFNFPFSTFNLKKLTLGHNMFLILQTVTAKQSVGNIPTDLLFNYSFLLSTRVIYYSRLLIKRIFFADFFNTCSNLFLAVLIVVKNEGDVLGNLVHIFLVKTSCSNSGSTDSYTACYER